MKRWNVLVWIGLTLYIGYSLWHAGKEEMEQKKVQEHVEQIRMLESCGFGGEQLSEVQCFPVAEERKWLREGVLAEETEQCFSYEDSFKEARNYGGEREHEGTDIMARNGVVGYYPVLSMTDGVVEQLGWLELGGYRVGVRSPSGVYYYYAHLDSYAKDLEMGQEISAGQLLGYMGDSGYGAEGTRGQFPVHLHLGVYLGDPEEAINPYPLLQYAEKYMFSFTELEN